MLIWKFIHNPVSNVCPTRRQKVCCHNNNICQTFYRSAWHQIKVKGQQLQLSGCLLLKQIYFTHTDVFPLDTFSIRNDNFFWNTTSERKVWFLTKTCMTKSLGLNSYSMLGVSWQQTALSFIATFKKHTKMVQVTIKDKHREGRNKQRNISHITYCISLLCWNKQAHQR